MNAQTENALVEWLKTVNLFEVVMFLGVSWIILSALIKSIPVMHRILTGLTQMQHLDTMNKSIEDITRAIYDEDEHGNKISKLGKMEAEIQTQKTISTATVEKLDKVINETKIAKMMERAGGIED